MTTIMEVPHGDAALQAGVTQLTPNDTPFQIKRTGARPLRFQGIELAMAMSFTPNIPYWYEINIYRTNHQSFVVAIRRFHQSEDVLDTTQAWEVGSLEDAIDLLLAYDASVDVPLSFDFQKLNAHAAEVATLGMQLCAQIEDSRHHFKSLVGEFLYDLENES
ncbi:hypothetical protein SLH49_10825 [Cognatiyoonia sp. IB215446]|uniref:hypothetical protein n=1 Tax=Cognatiyoonia sp. IB215446 TaxID=3097355 RepID=UPI002A0D1DD6|nr:hypothetical protein [Cognatiyoonia sp. IB215446]MDX8348480.1 hypothetical protein [Cognatiyoonia sp. IB215446]